jgi:hypothetical protein
VVITSSAGIGTDLEVELRRIGPHYVVAAVRGNRQLKSLSVFYNSRNSLKCQTNEKIAHFSRGNLNLNRVKKFGPITAPDPYFARVLPASAAFAIDDNTIRFADTQLLRQIGNDTGWHSGKVVEEGAEEPHRAELDGKPEPHVIRIPPGTTALPRRIGSRCCTVKSAL